MRLRMASTRGLTSEAGRGGAGGFVCENERLTLKRIGIPPPSRRLIKKILLDNRFVIVLLHWPLARASGTASAAGRVLLLETGNLQRFGCDHTRKLEIPESQKTRSGARRGARCHPRFAFQSRFRAPPAQ